MKKRNSKHEKRVRRMIVACGLCAIILTASTYAWFVGMKTVNISAFDVSIAAIDSLSLSLDGQRWEDTVLINEDTYDIANYDDKNSWGGEGLIPMSSVGLIDSAASRMILYEKGSFTVTPGGYRVMATRAHNEFVAGDGGEDTGTEADGYVAFDLFIKNLSGNEYYGGTANPLNEEAIYLTPESAVKVATAGGKPNTGIENSVRVAFAQIGRIKATIEDKATIQGISCTASDTVTSICSRTAQIWEPNDTKHVQNAINWYDQSCKKRTGSSSSFVYGSDKCLGIVDNKYYQTYAISGRVDAEHYVDVYDGNDYNTYTGTLAAYNPLTDSLDSVASKAGAGKLLAFNTFTDTEKHLEGVDRPQLLTLAPNSITKVRIYIWIEGQDVDNYDFASLGKQISVAFGFTKERYYGEDIDYNDSTPTGPALPTNVNSRPSVPSTAAILDDGRVTTAAGT